MALSLPTHLHFLDPQGAIAYLIDQASGKKTALFLTETGAKRLDFLPVIERMRREGALTWIKTIPPYPCAKDIADTLTELGQDEIDLFIAIGGGSTMDLAKSVAALLPMAHGHFTSASVLSAIVEKTYLKTTQRPKLIAVPTTAGSGSELTRWAILWDFEQTLKLTVETPDLAFDEALIVIDYTATMPLRLSLSSGLDALCQATEAYWAKTTTPVIQRLSLQAIRLIVSTLPKVLKEPDNLEFRKHMMFGSILGAIAFSNTRTTACHSISYPLTLKFHLDHGLACVLTLPDLLRHNLSSLTNPESLYEAFNINNPDALRTWIEKIAEGIVSLKLSDYGVREDDLAELAELSFSLGRMDNNPLEISREQVKAILKLHL